MVYVKDMQRLEIKKRREFDDELHPRKILDLL